MAEASGIVTTDGGVSQLCLTTTQKADQIHDLRLQICRARRCASLTLPLAIGLFWAVPKPLKIGCTTQTQH
jgi:hypothetical protein